MKRKELKALLAPLRSSSEPIEVEACGIRLEMRVLSAEDSQTIQQMVLDYSSPPEEGKDDKQSEGQYRQMAVELQHRMQVETLARSIVKINGMQDAVLDSDDGTGKVELRDFLREEVGDWDRPVLNEVYAIYSMKALQREIRTALAVKYEPVDVTLEIQRLERLLEQARMLQKKQQQALVDRVSDANDLAASEGGAPQPEPAGPDEQAAGGAVAETPAQDGEQAAAGPVEPDQMTDPAEPEVPDRISRSELLANPPTRAGIAPPDGPRSRHYLSGGSFLGDDVSANLEEAERQQIALRVARARQAPPPPPAPAPGEVRLPAGVVINPKPGAGALNPRFRKR